jgi:hypothetical protein
MVSYSRLTEHVAYYNEEMKYTDDLGLQIQEFGSKILE